MIALRRHLLNCLKKLILSYKISRALHFLSCGVYPYLRLSRPSFYFRVDPTSYLYPPIHPSFYDDLPSLKLSKNQYGCFIISNKFGPGCYTTALTTNVGICLQSEFWPSTQFHLVHSLFKPNRTLSISQSYILACSVHQFGHFLIESLASILLYSYYLSLCPEQNSAFILLTPSVHWFNFIKHQFPKVRYIQLEPDFLLRFNYKMPNTLSLPNLSQYLSARYLSSFFSHNLRVPLSHSTNAKDQVTFLYSIDSKRISNFLEIQEATKYLSILYIDPSCLPVQHIYHIISCSKLVISTQGSILLNLLICPPPKVLVLTHLAPSFSPSNEEVAGGYYYNTLIDSDFHYLNCDPYHEDPQPVNHPFSLPLTVNPHNMVKSIEDLLYSS